LKGDATATATAAAAPAAKRSFFDMLGSGGGGNGSGGAYFAPGKGGRGNKRTRLSGESLRVAREREEELLATLPNVPAKRNNYTPEQREAVLNLVHKHGLSKRAAVRLLSKKPGYEKCTHKNVSPSYVVAFVTVLHPPYFLAPPLFIYSLPSSTFT
jgi:hypothetical protein